MPYTTRPNRFHACNSLLDLEQRYIVLTSPEHLTMDGEHRRTFAEQVTELERVHEDYLARQKVISPVFA